MTYPWGHKRRFNSYVDHMRGVYGGRMQKLTIDAGFTCPNRDGTKGSGGCTFCLNDAFNPSYCIPEKTITQQLTEGIAFHQNRYRKAYRYLAYFQAFTNTYASAQKLFDAYSEALAMENIAGIVVGTRPDCMDDEKLDMFSDLSKRYYVLIEYGIESVYDKTLKRINRGHIFEDSVKAITMTAQKGIQVGGHMIFGLPGESRKDMLYSAGILSELPLNNIKFHQLQLFNGTRMAEEYTRDPDDFYIFDLDEYLAFIADYLELLNPAFVVERIAGEVPPRFAVLRPWGPRYDSILLKFEKLLESRDSWQGKHYMEKKQ